MLPVDPTSSAGQTPFYIAAVGPSSRPRHTLKQGDTFAVIDSHGEIGISAGGPDGVFHDGTRHLSRLSFEIDGAAPLVLGSGITEDNAGLVIELTNPDMLRDGRPYLPKDTVYFSRFFFLWDGVLHERCSIHNHGLEPVRFTLTYQFEADFADLFEVRGLHRPIRGIRRAPSVEPNGVTLTYLGLDKVERHTRLQFRPAPTALDRRMIRFDIRLEPGGRCSRFITIGCNQHPAADELAFLGNIKRARRVAQRARQRAPQIEIANERINQVFDRSLADLCMLSTDTPQGPYPYAGIPWYSTTFGRDGILTAIEALWADPMIGKGVLCRLAALQATNYDPKSDAEPGKILHEMRGGEMAALGEIPFRLYYGSVDSTPLFLMLAGLYFERTGDIDTMRRLWPNFQAALAWIDGPGDPDGDGFVEYHRATETGLDNQGWKDSHDSIFHADGRLAKGPIALVEVQAYVFAAKLAMAKVAAVLGEPDMAQRLRNEAERLRYRFEDVFWCEKLGTYALALDGDKRRCEVISSNAGHVLFGGIASVERACSVARVLLDNASFSGWGVRTIAQDERRFNPMSYHNGSVWPHDNAIIALGFAHYGLKREVSRIVDAMFDAACWMELSRLPELFCGFRRRERRGPTLYPVACAPQAWAAAAPLAFLRACLGMSFDPDEHRVQFVEPYLPSQFQRIKIRGLDLAGSRLDVDIRGRGRDISVAVTDRTGAGHAILVL
ncbi:MAG TPA: glycogen debranching N-terminal domain-containing protein [Geminicoccus sp.]|uniref:amylo-alpha-1,6-glucosidase n=1 Tax=Geminicoccus sp. TaxID=2024832 RepID=UPI002CF39FC7|nr:glycogen debranching N-terminal domain-containing protein [Geminicoccus sp.]HWL68883.1 glycogen debranching N-terminal domain-containing protein [Geminicoccus sp.]